MTADESDRHSHAADDPVVARTPEEVASAEAHNALRQFDRLRELIRDAAQAATAGGTFRLRPSTLCDLNRLAIQRLHPRAGAYRTVPISIEGASHQPPASEDVPRLVEDLCDYVNGEGAGSSAIHLASYVMWRLNWIHPFYDGNGRTTRAASYLVLCARLGYELPGTTAIPEIIAGDKAPYYAALEEADGALDRKHLDVSAMERLLEDALARQLASVIKEAQSARSGAEVPRPQGIRATSSTPTRDERQSHWKRQPRWRRVLIASVAVGSALAAGGWQLLIEWDNPRVKSVRDWIHEVVKSRPRGSSGGSLTGFR